MNQYLKYLPLLVTVVGTISAAVLTPAFVSMHPVVFASLNAASMILHAALPAVFGGPTNS